MADPVLSSAPTEPPQSGSPARWIALAVGIAVAVVAIGAGVWLWRSHSTPEGSYGTFGKTDGAYIEIAPGITAESFSEPSEDGRGDITLAGPSGVHITGTYQYTNDANWTIDVNGGSGQIGGVDLDSKDINGTIALTNDVVSTDVDAGMPNHPKLIKDWDQVSKFHIGYGQPGAANGQQPQAAGIPGLAQNKSYTAVQAANIKPAIPTTPGAFSGTMNINTSHGTGTLTGSGTVAADGTYTVTFSGTVYVDTIPLTLTGTYSSAGYKGSAEAIWNISGDIGAGNIKGMQVQSGHVASTNEVPEITGNMTAIMNIGSPMTIEFAVAITDENNWTLDVTGTREQTWTVASVPGLTVQESNLQGHLSNSDGVLACDLHTSSTVTVDGMTLSGTFHITSTTQWEIAVTDGSGTVLNSTNHHIDSVTGSLTYSNGAVDGTFNITDSAQTTVILPTSWKSKTTLAITYKKAPADAKSAVTVNADYEANDSKVGRISITGSYATPGAYKLNATATVGLGAGGTATLTGAYESAGYVDNGTTRTTAWWSITGSLANIPMGGGSILSSGTLSLTSDAKGFTGSAYIKPSSNNTFTIAANLNYTDSANWTFTVGIQGASPWTPNGFTNLTIDPNKLSGTVYSSAGTMYWAVVAHGVTWANMSTGVNMTSDLSVSTTCPLGNKCPGTTGIYLGATNGALTFPSPLPAMTATGAILASGGWGRFDATAGSVSFHGIGVSNTALTIWKGTRTDQYNPNLGMPDLSGSNNGLSMEFCGNFNAAIPDVTTITTGGCIEWTPSGVVMGQVAMGGNIDSGTTSTGIKIGVTTLSGFAWSDLTTKPTINLNGVATKLTANLNTITGTMTIPANVMKGMGNTSGVNVSFPATGWFSSGDFALDCDIPIGLSKQGVDLDSMDVHIGKSGHTFNLSFTANGKVKIRDTKFPLTATVGLVAGSSTEVYVSVAAKGVRSANPNGTFDYPTLLPSGNFEPESTMIIDGSWDSRPPTSLLTHGDFENAVPQGNLIPNADFEKYTGSTFVPNGDFEDATYSNMLNNSDAEDLDVLINGDFDADTYNQGWTGSGSTGGGGLYGGISMAGVADPGPGETNGTNIARLTNGNSSGTKTNTTGTSTSQNTGLMQWVSQQTLSGAKYTVGAWVRSPDSSTSRYQLGIVQDTNISGCSGTDSGQHGAIGTVTSTWTYVSFTANASNCRGHVAVWINVPDAKDQLDVDIVTLTTDRTGLGNTSYSILNTSEWNTSNAVFGTWSSPSEAHSGNQLFLMYSTNSSGYVQTDLNTAPDQYGTYTFSVWLNPKSTVSGSIKLQSVGGTTESASIPFTNLAANTWTRLTSTMTFNNSGHTSMIAMIYSSTTNGQIRYDDMYFGKVPYNPYSTVTGTAGQVVEFDPLGATNSNTSNSMAHAGSFSLSLTDENIGSNGVAAYYDFTPSGGISVGSTYTASVWMRKIAGTGTGNLWLRTNQGTSESVSRSITPTNDWQQVTISLPIRYTGHTSFRIEFDTSGDWTTVLYDDLLITAVNRTVAQDSSDVWTGAGSTSFGVYDNAPGAHGGNGYLAYSTASGNGPSLSKTVSVTAYAGQTYTASAWITGPSGASGRIQITCGSATTSVAFTQGSGYALQQASVLLPANVSSCTITLIGNAPNQGWQADDVSLSLAGLAQEEPWYTGSSPSTAVTTNAILSGASVAHGGQNYLEIKPLGTSGVVYKDVAGTFTAGQQYTFSGFVRSNASTSSTVDMTVRWFKAGVLMSTSYTRNTVTSDWTNVFTSVTPSAGDYDTVRLEINQATGNNALDIDDLTFRQDRAWSTTNTTTQMSVNDDRSNARDGSGYVRVQTTTADGGGIQASGASTITSGATYSMAGFIRNVSGSGNVSGTLYVTASGGSNGSETFTKTFTTSNDWQDLAFDFTTTKSNTTFTEKLVLNGIGKVDLDSFDLQPDKIIQASPWSTSVGSGGSVTYAAYNDPDNAHTDNGVGRFSTTGTNESGIKHDITQSVAGNSTWTMSAWVRVASGSTIPSGGAYVKACLAASGNGSTETHCQSTYINGYGWVLFNHAVTPGSSHTTLTASIVTTSPGVTFYVDDVVVQPASWVPTSNAKQFLVNDSNNSQSGSGYLKFSKSDTNAGGTSLTIPGSIPQNTNEIVTFWVKSGDGNPLNGSANLTVSGGGTNDTMSYSFTATDTWQQVTFTVPVAHSGQNTMKLTVYVNDTDRNLYLDSVDVDPNAGSEPDGINSDLPHPESGYIYLWDNAWGIPGAHLWSITAQISIIGGSPALGVGATSYYDPAANKALVGTAWLRGSMVANISSREPCFSFGFDGGNTGTMISIDGGVVTATKFQLTVAPRGCTVGAYMLAPGSVLAFDAGFGDATVHFDLQIGRDDNGLPTFYWDGKVSNVKLGGITYNTMELTINVTSSSSSVTFVGDFEMSMGKFYGSFDLSASSSGIRQKGQVNVTDWTMVGGTFDVSEFNYYMDVTIPFNGNCGSFETSSDGNLKMGNKKYNFNGTIATNCGQIQKLDFWFQYKKGGQTYTFYLKYDSSSHVLAGGLSWSFERSMSWKFWGHRYRRHPQFGISLNFYMDFDKPSTAYLTLSGRISVSGGNGSVTCTIGGSDVDDSCRLHVHVDPGGGRTYDSTW